MASPITPSSSGGRALSLTPGARVLQTPLSDETIWKRLKEAGFDEESIKRRDKAALVAYIAKLETEIFDLQHHMGLLLLERKELAAKNEELKASAETAELAHKRDQAAHMSTLAEARKREESLKKALGVEKECIASMEKTLHEMRAESAEIKVSADLRLAEARSMAEDAQKKMLDAESKLHASEALQAEALRYHRAAERKLQEVEAREDDITRRINAFKTDCDAKEKEIGSERQSLSERRKALQQEQERLLDAQALLNQREDFVASRSQELTRLEKELEALKENIEKELRSLNDEKSNLKVTVASLHQREEAVIEKEALLNKREQELLVLQGKLASKESVEIQKVIANHEALLRTRKTEFEAELEMKYKLAEDEIEAKRRAWELREVDLSQRADLLQERENELEIQSRALVDKERDAAEKLNILADKEKDLSAAREDIEMRRKSLQQEKGEIAKMKLDLQRSLDSLEDEKKQVLDAKEKLETMKSETDELSVLETKLKEEVDRVRTQEQELLAEEEKLKAEKAKFEFEWESIDEKREELRREAERLAQEREAISTFIKEERDSLRRDKEAMRDQHKHDVESLHRDREEFMNKMEQERAEWFSRIQEEQAKFLSGIEMHKRELESSVEKRREEVESYLKDKEKAFELEKRNELQHISALREKTVKEMEQVALETKKLQAEREKINLEREQREDEWAVLNRSIEELKVQTQKLEKQRELLHREREEISAQIEQLNRLDDLKLALDMKKVVEMQNSSMVASQQKLSAIRNLDSSEGGRLVSPKLIGANSKRDSLDASLVKRDVVSPHSSSPLSWLKRCTQLVFKNPPSNSLMKSGEKSSTPGQESAKSESAGKLDSSNGYHEQKLKSIEDYGKRPPRRYAFDEPKVIVEVPRGHECANESHFVDSMSEIKDDAKDCMLDSFSESKKLLQGGIKRRVDNSLLDESVDSLAELRQIHKKRKQNEIVATDVSEDAIDQCNMSNQANAPDHQHSTGVAEDTDLLIVDKIVKISELTFGITDVDNFANLEKVVQAQDSGLTSNKIEVQDGGTNGLTNSRNVDKKVLPSGSEVSEMFNEEHLANAGHGSEQSEIQEEASKRAGHVGEDCFAAKTDRQEGINENIGKRTRSRQNL
ncbi:hypothetical protein Tsubulata_037646 [Turnera subulata]|uniref:Protein CROWDED NUCLEI 4 n=1 Tax=Turnera subulata TaxID=218843 RepID=A0A9Q0FKJ7_9ROSI|nr:hypothetical protein Tsubulata_037646 [Turnera subulata]